MSAPSKLYATPPPPHWWPTHLPAGSINKQLQQLKTPPGAQQTHSGPEQTMEKVFVIKGKNMGFLLEIDLWL